MTDSELDALDLLIRDVVRRHYQQYYEGETAVTVADMWFRAQRGLLREVAEAGRTAT